MPDPMPKLKRIRFFLADSPVHLFLLLFTLSLGICLASHFFEVLDSFQAEEHYRVLIDPGHGGQDPGKISSSGVLEKDINLSIAKKCQSILEQNGVSVTMTRTEDVALSSDSSNQKSKDLQRRRQMIEEGAYHCAVSIHQNSYPDASQHGAQVFFYPGSEKGKLLAGLLQAQLANLTEQENKREIKSNSDYYLLKSQGVPTVIAEICFLSNPSETELICKDSVQERAAFFLAMGILQYLHAR